MEYQLPSYLGFHGVKRYYKIFLDSLKTDFQKLGFWFSSPVFLVFLDKSRFQWISMQFQSVFWHKLLLYITGLILKWNKSCPWKFHSMKNKRSFCIALICHALRKRFKRFSLVYKTVLVLFLSEISVSITTLLLARRMAKLICYASVCLNHTLRLNHDLR